MMTQTDKKPARRAPHAAHLSRYLRPVVAPALVLALLASPVVAAELPTGFFAGASAGVGVVSANPIGLAEVDEDTHGVGAGKLTAGYWFHRNWGVSVGYAALGNFTQKYTTGEFRGRARSLMISALGRLPLTDRWTLIGSVSATRNRIDDRGSTPGVAEFSKLHGSKSNLVFPGLELQYRLSDKMSLSFEVQGLGKAAEKVDVGYAGVGLRWNF
ncbi:MAG: outer membrane beta-barrel protein [Burkholderiaceae bacterium]